MRCTVLLCSSLLACGVTGPQARDDDGSTFDSGTSTGTSSSAGSGGETAGAGGSSSVGSGPGSSGSGNGESTSSSSGAGGMTDPDCYGEPLDPAADISDVVAAYGGSNFKDEVIEAMDRRWPAGAFLLTEQKNDPYFNQFSDSSSWTGMVGWLDTLVHEETHLFNAYHAQSQSQVHALYFRDDLIVYLPAEQGFPRSEIVSHLAASVANSIYTSTYLTGSQGQRAFNPLLDEATAYANEVPGMASFGEFYNGGVSLRDGSAAFLYFLEIYLRVARTDHASFYAWAKSQPAYVDAVRILWLRTHFFYEAVGDAHPNLGIHDATYRAEAYQPDNLAEITMFIGRAVGPSSCLLD